MKILTATEVHREAVSSLGLDASALDLATIEALAAAIRRAAGLFCPCTSRTLLQAVLGPLVGLASDQAALSEDAENTLEALIAYGDLLEQRSESGEGSQRLLYVAPPAFVARRSGASMLLGIAPEQNSPLPEQLSSKVQYANHVRRLPAGGEELKDQLRQLGLIELSMEAWLKAPAHTSPAEFLVRTKSLLAASKPVIEIPGLTIIDPKKPAIYYRGRWVEKLNATGFFVGRRPQAYGADLWCYVELRDGRPQRFLDLPPTKCRWRGCDEAWRLQAAIDVERGEPQRYRIRRGASGFVVLDFFSPVPLWASRRWDAIGEPIPRNKCLFSYCLPESEVSQEIQFIRDELWLSELT